MGFSALRLRMPDAVSFPAGGVSRGTRDEARLRVVLCSVGFTVVFAWVCSRWEGSDGATAAWSDGINLLWLGGCALWTKDRALGRLLAAAGVFGVSELLADFLCVRCTGTLDYAVARSTLVLSSPWWMPLSWAVVAVQVGVVGDAAVRRFGLRRGILLGGMASALLIPVYEELAWGARWWRYQHCLCLGHTPVYIVLAEAIIGTGITGLGYGVLRVCTPRAALWLALIAGLMTILGGTVGWGVVEFIGRGAHPIWPFPW